MPTKLTTPVVRSTATDVVIDRITLDLLRASDLSLTPDSGITVDFSFRDAAGLKLDAKVVQVNAADLPSGLRTIARNLVTSVSQTLRARGAIPEGTDSNDL